MSRPNFTENGTSFPAHQKPASEEAGWAGVGFSLHQILNVVQDTGKDPGGDVDTEEMCNTDVLTPIIIRLHELIDKHLSGIDGHIQFNRRVILEYDANTNELRF